MAQNKADLLKKIKFQVLKTINFTPTDEDRVKMAQSVLNSLVDTGDTVLDSEMPETLFGASLDWSAGTANDNTVDISLGNTSVEQDLDVNNIEVIVDTTPPAEVTTLVATSGDTSVSLTWTDPVDADFDHVEIWYGIGNTDTQFTGTINNTGTDITGLVNGSEYTFLVKTIDVVNNISAGTLVNATPAI